MKNQEADRKVGNALSILVARTITGNLHTMINALCQELTVVWNRNGKQYCDAYHEKSVPINFPIPASLPGYKADLPIRINKKVEGVKPGPPEDLDSEPLMPIAKALVLNKACLDEGKSTYSRSCWGHTFSFSSSRVPEPIENICLPDSKMLPYLHPR